jgi:hypothetical protein
VVSSDGVSGLCKVVLLKQSLYVYHHWERYAAIMLDFSETRKVTGDGAIHIFAGTFVLESLRPPKSSQHAVKNGSLGLHRSP